MATHSSVLAWRIPGTEEPGGLPSMGSHRVGHDRRDLAALIMQKSKTRELNHCPTCLTGYWDLQGPGERGDNGVQLFPQAY